MKILKTYTYAHEAHLDLAKLQDEGIEAVIIDENIVTMQPFYSNAVGGIKLRVHDEDFERASDIMNTDYSDELKEVYDEEIEPLLKCPNCGSSKIYQERSLILSLIVSFFILFGVNVGKQSYACTDCNHKWKGEGERRVRFL